MLFPQVKKILIITLVLNWLVAVAKILIGFSTGALSVLADGLHSLFDGMSNILGLIGVKLAERPRDSSHPYGHQKFESLAACGIAFLILITGYELLKDVIGRFLSPASPQITFLSFAVMGGALTVDLAVFLYENYWGKKLNSSILIADSLHTKTHLLTTPAVILGMIAIKVGFPILDPLIASFVLLMLVKLAWEIVSHTSIVLCDKAFVDDRQIKDIALKVKGIKSAHQIRSRGDLHHVFLDMHIILNSELSLKDAHQISHNLKKKITEDIPQIKDIVIHFEPEIC